MILKSEVSGEIDEHAVKEVGVRRQLQHGDDGQDETERRDEARVKLAAA